MPHSYPSCAPARSSRGGGVPGRMSAPIAAAVPRRAPAELRQAGSGRWAALVGGPPVPVDDRRGHALGDIATLEEVVDLVVGEPEDLLVGKPRPFALQVGGGHLVDDPLVGSELPRQRA